ncbi:S9 family peptidase [Tahibacter soli]|uniref:Prolyl oligopeptidase family serine peptidase n=1 Tax=Tahibacter soli TaxID=2983605 RepID=A0A9X3YMU2_9GAMM|nr:prolyl oligopeptidase family serine peptidase [Tahibacter soli]MDC8013653.1 prolyl oligopeptidase family serine peptidase [Tahibacter soli]
MFDYQGRRLPARALACAGVLVLFAATAAAKDDPAALKPGQGLLLVAIENSAAAWSVRIDGDGGDHVVKDLVSGRNTRLLKLPAGTYRYSRADRSDDMRFSMDRPDNRARFTFTVEPGVVNYPGELVLRMLSPHRISGGRFNRAAFAMAMFDRDAPGARSRLPWRTDAGAPDPFPEFLASKVDAAGMARLVESSGADARQTREAALAPDFAAAFKDLFVPQTAAMWPQISPGGDFVAYKEVRPNQETAVVVDLASGESVKIMTVAGVVESVLWTGDRSLIVGFRKTLTGILAQSPGKKSFKPSDAASGIELVRLRDGALRDDALERVRWPDVTVVDALPDDPERFIVMRADEDGARHLFALDKRASGYNPLDFRPGRRLDGDWKDKTLLRGFVDGKGAVRAAIVLDDPKTGTLALMRRDGDAWTKLRELTEVDLYDPVALSFDGASLLVRTDEGRDQTDIVRIPLDGSAEDTVLSVPGVNIVAATIRTRDRALLGGYVYRAGTARLHYAEGDAGVPKALAASFPDAHVAVVDASRDGRRTILDVHAEDAPNAYYLYDATKRKVEKLFDVREPFVRAKPARSVALAPSGTDGRPLDAYLTLPAGAGPFPLVVMPNAAGERYAFDPTLQLFVHHGFAVLRVGNRAGADVDLALDAALAKHPIDARRVALFGVAGGGHAALMRLASSPQRYRCGVTVSAITDLPLMFSASVWNARPAAVARMKRLVGDPASDLDLLRANSPVYQFEKLTQPLLIVHGTEDMSVPFEHAWRLRSLLANAGRPPGWLPLPDADETLSQPADRLALHAASDRFLRECLTAPAATGGNATPSGL